MSLLNKKSTTAIGLVLSSIFLGQAYATNLPDEKYVRIFAVTAADVENAPYVDRVVGFKLSAIQKVLTALNPKEHLESLTPIRGGYGQVYLTESMAIKSSTPAVVTPEQEVNALISLKNSIAAKPVRGFDVSLPKVFYKPISASAAVVLGDHPYHIHVSTKVRPVKAMRKIMEDALLKKSAPDLLEMNTIGKLFGMMQSGSLVLATSGRNYGEYVCDIHLDPNFNNIMPTRLTNAAQLGAYTLIDMADFTRGSAADARPLSSDIIYFLYKGLWLGYANNVFQTFPVEKQKDNVLTFANRFYTGYFSTFTKNQLTTLKETLTTKKAMDLYLANQMYQISIYVSYNDLLPTIQTAFRANESIVPAAVKAQALAPAAKATPKIATPAQPAQKANNFENFDVFYKYTVDKKWTDADWDAYHQADWKLNRMQKIAVVEKAAAARIAAAKKAAADKIKEDADWDLYFKMSPKWDQKDWDLYYQNYNKLNMGQRIALVEQAKANKIAAAKKAVPAVKAAPVKVATPAPVAKALPAPIKLAAIPAKNPPMPIKLAAIPSAQPAPAKAPVAVKAPVPAKAPAAVKAPVPAKTPAAVKAPVPAKAPVAVKAPVPAKAPVAVKAPVPAKAPAAKNAVPAKAPAAKGPPAPIKLAPIPKKGPPAPIKLAAIPGVKK